MRHLRQDPSASRHRVDSLTTYLHDITGYALLSRVEEVALAPRIHAGDREALNRLVCANLRFVVAVAKQYQHRGVSLSDLIDEGNLGLIHAAEKFDETKGVKFISYAVWWIRQSIIEALADQAHTIRVPISRAAMLHRAVRQANTLRQQLGREPTQHELAVGLQVSDAMIASAAPVASYVSLDAPFADDEGARLLDYLPDEAGPAPDEGIVDTELHESVYAALACLKGREARVVRLYFGFDEDEAMTLERIGELLGVTRERVRQIKEKALTRIRKSRQARALAPYCGR